MVDLFFRTASQALQAFLPIAFALAAFRRRDDRTAIAGIRWGIGAAAVATAPAGALFQRSLHQSLSEAVLAMLALGSIVWLIGAAARERRIPPIVIALVTVLVITRQTMEIATVFTVAAFDLRSRDAVTAIAAAASLGFLLSAVWAPVARRLNADASRVANRVFLALFLGQLSMYAFHESAEARLLPWSETLHAATEPYGPDGVYGRHFSWFLIAAPLVTAAALALGRRRRGALRYAIAAFITIIAAGGGLSLRSAEPPPEAPGGGVAAMADAPHVLFRHTLNDQAYARLEIASLANPSSQRQSLGMPCERVAFAGERGICLQARRGVFTTYQAVLFDRTFNTLASWKLSGSPSRVRVAADGRVAAITVFVTGHGYGSPFSTKTTLVDTASGDALGDLEQFTTWRNRTRIKADDFNYWGVTFGRDSNNFYVTLGSAGKTYLVRGDLALRKLTVLYEGVECPSVSPDERLIAFKKRLGTKAGSWRLAILDVQTMTERLLASETRNVDDQAEWLDNDRLLYALPRPNSGVTDVWVAPIAAGQARIFIPGAESPAVVRQPGAAGSRRGE